MGFDLEQSTREDDGLEAVLQENMLVIEEAVELPVETTKTHGLWRYVANVLGEKVIRGGKSGLGKAAMYVVGGGLPKKTQRSLEKRLGQDRYDVLHATMTNALVTMPLLYGAGIYTIWNSGLSEDAKIAFTIPLAIYGGAESFWRGLAAFDGDIFGSALFSAPFYIGKGMVSAVKKTSKKAKDFVGDVVSQARERQSRDRSGKHYS